VLRFLALLALAALVLAASPAAAQDQIKTPLEIKIQPPAERVLLPEIAVLKLVGQLKIGCSAEGLGPQSDTVRFKVESTAPYAAAIISPAETTITIPPQDCADPAYRKVLAFDVLVSLAPDAPAYETFPTKVSAVLEGNTKQGPVFATENLTVGFMPRLTVDAPQTSIKVKPGKHFEFPITVSTRSNGATKVSFEVAPVGSLKMPNMQPPPTIVVPYQQGGAASPIQIKVEGKAPGGGPGSNFAGGFELRTKASAADPQGVLTDQNAAQFALTVVGAAPGPGPILLILSLASIAAMRRRSQ
jgi:hypothetical protein